MADKKTVTKHPLEDAGLEGLLSNPPKETDAPKGMGSEQGVEAKAKSVEKQIIQKTTKSGLAEGFVRSTLIIRETYLTNLKLYSVVEKRKLYEVLDEALQDYMNKLEKQKIQYLKD